MHDWQVCAIAMHGEKTQQTSSITDLNPYSNLLRRHITPEIISQILSHKVFG